MKSLRHRQIQPLRDGRRDNFYSFVIEIRNLIDSMAILEFLLVMGLGGFAGLLIVKNVNENKQKQRLDEAFYQLLETQNSQISLIQLAANARVEAEVAQQYLTRQVKIFSAVLEVDDEGDTFYRFPRLRLPPSSSKEW
ncbi:hypothetical protein [Microcoleus vaginatus]|uniref:hypothetical protein n=2 Tax=Microcoleus vaginatus TaxID=119532 RepID=UPI00020D2159|nr:hypothetical protein MicvaDRAFT_4520 [Microcoleus vaginatus FGP-2]